MTELLKSEFLYMFRILYAMCVLWRVDSLGPWQENQLNTKIQKAKIISFVSVAWDSNRWIVLM